MINCFQPFSLDKSIKLTTEIILNIVTIIANPIADSAAAMVRTIRAKIWPVISFNQIEEKEKKIFTAKSNNSIAIKRIKRF